VSEANGEGRIDYYYVGVFSPRPVIQRLSRVVELTIGNKGIELGSGLVHSLPSPASRQSFANLKRNTIIPFVWTFGVFGMFQTI
jgi:hypothetical protein